MTSQLRSRERICRSWREAQRMRDEGQDELHQALLNILANREEELRATIQAIDSCCSMASRASASWNLR